MQANMRPPPGSTPEHSLSRSAVQRLMMACSTGRLPAICAFAGTGSCPAAIASDRDAADSQHLLSRCCWAGPEIHVLDLLVMRASAGEALRRRLCAPVCTRVQLPAAKLRFVSARVQYSRPGERSYKMKRSSTTPATEARHDLVLVNTHEDPMKPTLPSSSLLAAALALGGLVLTGPSAMAAPVTPIHPVVNSTHVQQVHYGYCRRWYRECRYRWGAGWRFRRCMRAHGC
jgi:hypothetical protein